MTFTPGKLACLVFLAVICAQTQAQQSARPKPSPAPIDDNDVIRINTNVVQVDAIVVDKNGKFVTDLKAEDFEIVEEGKNFRADYFSYVPLTDQRTEQVEGTQTTVTRKPITIDEVKRTFVFVVDNPLIDIVFANANAFGMSTAVCSRRKGSDQDHECQWTSRSATTDTAKPESDPGPEQDHRSNGKDSRAQSDQSGFARSHV